MLSARRVRVSSWWPRALKGAALALVVALFARTMAGVDLAAVAARIERAGFAIALVPLPYLVEIALDAAAVRALLAAIGRRVPFARLYGVRLACEAVSTSLPAGTVFAESLGPWLLATRCGAPASDGVAAMTAKRWLIMRAHGVYIAASALFGWTWLVRGGKGTGVDPLPWLVLGAALVPLALSAGIEATVTRGSIAARARRALRAVPIARLRAWLDGQGGAFAATDARLVQLARPGATAAPLALLLGAWLVESVETTLLLNVLGAPLSFAAVLSIEAGLSLVRCLAFFAPGGLGVQDLGYVALLGAYGVPDAAATSAAFVLLKRAKEVLFGAVGYTLLFAWKRPARAAMHAGPATSSPSTSPAM